MKDGDPYIRLPGPPPYDADSCESYGEQLSDNGAGYNLVSGAGPVIQMFDGRWALAEIVWTDDIKKLGAIRLVSITEDEVTFCFVEAMGGRNR